ncbi:MAG: serine hydrolase domain-containing protein [Dysgonamonadaceae bacterium]
MKKYFIIMLLNAIGCFCLFGQFVPTDNKLTMYFHHLSQNNKFIGSISVFREGNEIYNNCVGYADIEKNIKANRNTKYRIGSISKIYTATMILKAVEDGKLFLDQTIDIFFPFIKNSKIITIGQLLQHRSGIHSFTDGEAFFQWNTEFKNKSEMLSIIEQQGIDFEPGTQMKYSNSNYVLLSYILEDIYNKTYDQIFYNDIIKNLGLKNTLCGFDRNMDNTDCSSYIFYKEKWNKQTSTNLSTVLGAGSIITTPYELNIFVDNLFNGNIVSQESLDQMTTIKDNFGMGIRKMKFQNYIGYGFGGHIDGFNSFFMYIPIHRISCVILSNGLNMYLNDIAKIVFDDIFNNPYDIPNFDQGILKTIDLDKYLGTYSTLHFPIKLAITKNGDTLVAQGTGQPAFNLEYFSEHKFIFYSAKIEIEFKPEEDSLILKQGGATFIMKKE